MKLWMRPAAVLLMAAAMLGVAAGPAHAEGGRISNQETEEATRTVRFQFNATDPALKVDPGTVKATAAGRPLNPDVRQITKETVPKQVAVLVIDTSGSMTIDNRIGEAQAAAQVFLNTVPDHVEVGLITFDTDVRTLVRPTIDRSAVRRAVQGLEADGDTALYDAILQAVRLVGTSGSRNIFLLSDGQDDGSTATLGRAVQDLKRAKDVRLDAVAVGLESDAERAIKQLTAAGRGTLISTDDAAALSDSFEQVALSYTGGVTVSVQIPADLAQREVNLTVEAVARGENRQPVTISAAQPFLVGAPLPRPTPTRQINTGPRAVAVDPGPWRDSMIPYVALALVFAGVSIVLGFAFNAFQPVGQRGRISRRLAIYTLGARPTPLAREATVFGQGAVMQGAVDLASRFVAQRQMEVGLRRRLDAAGLPLKPAEWALIQVGSTLLLPLILVALTGSVILAVLGLFIGGAAPIAFLMVAESRRRQRFVDQLPDTLQLISGSLSTGYSLPQALDSVVQEGTEPVASEFNRALVDHRLGRPIDDSLRAIAARMRSEEWHWVVMAIRIQREVGGNLAELLSTVADTLRDRARLHRQVRALSAEGKLSSYILIGLPIAFAIYLLVTQPRYLGVLLTDPIGLLGLGMSVVLLILGALWLRRLVKVEI